MQRLIYKSYKFDWKWILNMQIRWQHELKTAKWAKILEEFFKTFVKDVGHLG